MAHNINISNYGGGADDSGGAGDVVGSGDGEPFFASYPVLPACSTKSAQNISKICSFKTIVRFVRNSQWMMEGGQISP